MAACCILNCPSDTWLCVVGLRAVGVTVFTRPTSVAEPEGAAAAAERADSVEDEGTPNARRRPVRGDRVTVCKQPRNTDFLQPGQVGTVVDIDDMDIEDVWFTVEDADGETDEYCEADLVIAGADVVERLDESRVIVPALAAPEPAPAGEISSGPVSQGPKKSGAGGGVEIAASAQKLMAESKVKGLFDDSDDSEGSLSPVARERDRVGVHTSALAPPPSSGGVLDTGVNAASSDVVAGAQHVSTASSLHEVHRQSSTPAAEDVAEDLAASSRRDISKNAGTILVFFVSYHHIYVFKVDRR